MGELLQKLLKAILPAGLLTWLKYDLLDGFSVKSYSLEGEDMILRRIFERQKQGFYVDTGAHHPKRFSNTYFFYRRGWSGINIDAMPGSMELFRNARPRDINIEAAIGCGGVELIYHMFNEPAYNGFSVELSDERDGSGAECRVTDRVPMRTVSLVDVLDNHMARRQRIDFMNVDVEGVDLDVLHSNDWSKYRPRIVLVELLGVSLDQLSQDPIVLFLREKGYDAHAKCVNTVLFRTAHE